MVELSIVDLPQLFNQVSFYYFQLNVGDELCKGVEDFIEKQDNFLKTETQCVLILLVEETSKSKMELLKAICSQGLQRNTFWRQFPNASV